MIPGKFSLQRWHILIAVLAGTIVRLAFGKYSNAWMGAADQLAWGLSLDYLSAAACSYKQLIHYPHEGGSFFISLLALCLKPFENSLPALSLAALLIDTASRYLQIVLTRRIFGAATASWFAAWTILSIPLLLPWGTVNYGLHSLSSFLPFIFIYVASRNQEKISNAMLCGAVTGLSLSFSYNNIIFIPAFFIWLVLSRRENSIRHCLFFLLCLCITVLPHIMVRFLADQGFHLEQLNPGNIRGVDWSEASFAAYGKRIAATCINTLPASFFLSAGNIPSWLYVIVTLTFCITGIIYFIVKKTNKSIIQLCCLLLMIYLIAYAISPFFSASIKNKNFAYYRHFSYILPLLAVMLIHGLLSAGRYRYLLSSAWLVVCTCFSCVYMCHITPRVTPLYHPTGWILARKYGDTPPLLVKLSAHVPAQHKEELLMGYGWGLTAIILEEKKGNDSMSVKQLMDLYRQFPADQKEAFRKGISHAFDAGITPVLDPALLPQVTHGINEVK